MKCYKMIKNMEKLKKAAAPMGSEQPASWRPPLLGSHNFKYQLKWRNTDDEPITYKDTNSKKYTFY